MNEAKYRANYLARRSQVIAALQKFKRVADAGRQVGCSTDSQCAPYHQKTEAEAAHLIQVAQKAQASILIPECPVAYYLSTRQFLAALSQTIVSASNAQSALKDIFLNGDNPQNAQMLDDAQFQLLGVEECLKQDIQTFPHYNHEKGNAERLPIP